GETGRRGGQRGKTKSEHGRFPCLTGRLSETEGQATLLREPCWRGIVPAAQSCAGNRRWARTARARKKPTGKFPWAWKAYSISASGKDKYTLSACSLCSRLGGSPDLAAEVL